MDERALNIDIISHANPGVPAAGLTAALLSSGTQAEESWRAHSLRFPSCNQNVNHILNPREGENLFRSVFLCFFFPLCGPELYHGSFLLGRKKLLPRFSERCLWFRPVSHHHHSCSLFRNLQTSASGLSHAAYAFA